MPGAEQGRLGRGIDSGINSGGVPTSGWGVTARDMQRALFRKALRIRDQHQPGTIVARHDRPAIPTPVSRGGFASASP